MENPIKMDDLGGLKPIFLETPNWPFDAVCQVSSPIKHQLSPEASSQRSQLQPHAAPDPCDRLNTELLYPRFVESKLIIYILIIFGDKCNPEFIWVDYKVYNTKPIQIGNSIWTQIKTPTKKIISHQPETTPFHPTFRTKTLLVNSMWRMPRFNFLPMAVEIRIDSSCRFWGPSTWIRVKWGAHKLPKWQWLLRIFQWFAMIYLHLLPTFIGQMEVS